MTLREEPHEIVDRASDEDLEILARRIRPAANPTSDEEFERAMDAIAAMVDPDTPPIPLEELRRENMYA